MQQTLSGFNGERVDPVSGITHLGMGYRDYNPVLKRFHCPDDWSPFGQGGINAYSYCAGDPINRADPSGHMSWQGITGIVLGVAGLAMIPFTMGQSVTAVTCLLAGLDVISGITSIVSGVLENKNAKISKALDWISLAAGMVSFSSGVISGSATLMWRAAQINNTMVMDLESEFRYLTTLGRTRPTGRLLNQSPFMSVVYADRYEDAARDTYQRLNIWAFGHPPDRLVLNGRALSPGSVASALDAAGIDLEEYNLVRFVSCDSVNLAHGFTNATGMTSTGFRDAVTVQGHTVATFRALSETVLSEGHDTSIQLFNSSAMLYPERTRAMGINIFEDHRFFRITAGNPVSFRIHHAEAPFVDMINGDPLPGWMNNV